MAYYVANCVWLFFQILPVPCLWICRNGPTEAGLKCSDNLDLEYLGAAGNVRISTVEEFRVSHEDKRRFEKMYPDYKDLESAEDSRKVALREELKRRFNWNIEKQVPYLFRTTYEDHRVSKKYLDTTLGTTLFSFVANCLHTIKHDSKLETFKIQVPTVPFTFTYWTGNCTPKDEYYPLTNEKDKTTWFNNSDTMPKPYTGDSLTRTIGVGWKLGESRYTGKMHEGIVDYTDKDLKDLGSSHLWYKFSKVLKTKMDSIGGDGVSKDTGFNWTEMGDDFYKRASPRDGGFYYIPRETSAKLYELVASCGNFNFYTNIIYTRYYYFGKGDCWEQPKVRKGTIEDCSVCPKLDCPQIAVVKN